MTLHSYTRLLSALFALLGIGLATAFFAITERREAVAGQAMILHESVAQVTGLRLAVSEFAEAFEPRSLQDAAARSGAIRRSLDSIKNGRHGTEASGTAPGAWPGALDSLGRVERLLALQLRDIDSVRRGMPDGHIAANLRLDSEALATHLTSLRSASTRVLERWDLVAKGIGYAFVGVLLALLAVAMHLLERRILRPLGRLSHALGAVSNGDWSTRVGMRRNDEIGALARAFDHMLDRLQDSSVSRASLEAEVGERRQAEAALRESERRLHLALSAAGAGTWDWSLLTGKVTWSPESFALYGLDPSAGAPEYDDWLALIAPEDRPRVHDTVQQVMAGDGEWNIEFRISTPHTGPRWLLSLGNIESRRDGALLAISGITLDITARKHAELQLRLLGQVFEQAPEGILVTDRDNRIVTVNTAFTELTGYDAEEVRGQSPSLLASGRTIATDYAGLWEAVREKGYWEGELWDKRKDGTCYPKLLRISVLRDADGSISHHVGHFSDITERKAAEEKIHHLAHHDTLTGLLNRFSLRLRLDHSIAEARRKGDQLAVLFIDMDRFKAINDTLGHTMGDRVLMEVASRLQACVREHDLVARLGGDEFVVVLTGMSATSAQRAMHKAPHIVRRLGKAYVFDGRNLNTTPSVGVSLYPADGEDADTLMKNADTAMYHAKARGRNNVQFFSTSMNQAVVERQQLEQALRLADPRNEFILHFQPQLRGGDAEVVGFEALVRWRHPELGLVPPARFIPIAEETGLIESIGRWVLENACDTLWNLKRRGHRNVRMAVNLSMHQLRDPNLVDFLSRLVTGYDLGPDELELEITESVAMEDPEATIAVLNRLRGMRIALAIDDFGTGYSSLAYLKRLPIQRLKLDRSFVQDIESDPNDAHICSAVIALAHSLGLEVVAEGVETEGQLSYLRQLRCDVIQGYYYSRPLPVEEAQQFLHSRGLFSPEALSAAA